MTDASMLRYRFWVKERDIQRKWFRRHGGGLEAYVSRYGDYGNGGEAIFKADKAALDYAEEKVREARKLWSNKQKA
jgi:hypothetical protein